MFLRQKIRRLWIFLWSATALTGLPVLFWHSTEELYFRWIFFHAVIGLSAFLVGLAFLLRRYVTRNDRVSLGLLITAITLQSARILMPAIDILSLTFSIFTLLVITIREILGVPRGAKRALEYGYIALNTVTFLIFFMSLQMGRNPFAPFFYRSHGYFAVVAIFIAGMIGGLYWRSRRREVTFRPVVVGVFFLCLLFLLAGLASSYYKNHYWDDETDLSSSGVYSTFDAAPPAVGRTAGLPKHFVNESAGCRNCHVELTDQWLGSTHRYAVKNRFYQKVIREYIVEFGVEAARFCINCHDPATVLSGDLQNQYNLINGRMDNTEGVSCKACHIITRVDSQIGNGLIRVRAEKPYPGFENLANEANKEKYFRAILADPRAHIRAFSRKRFYKTSEYCISCHLVTVRGTGADQPPMQLHTLFEQWEKSPWKDELTCAECHLPTFQMDRHGYPFYDHRILGSNNALHLLAIDPSPKEMELIRELETMTNSYLKGTLSRGFYEEVYDPRTKQFTRNPAGRINTFMTGFVYGRGGLERYHRLQQYMGSGPIIGMNLTAEVTDGVLAVNILSRNERVGHNFPSGPIDVNEGWLELTVRDATGKTIYHSGYLDERHYLEPNAHYLGCREALDAAGRPVTQHQFWRIRRVIGARVFKAKGTLTDDYRIPLPTDAVPPVKIEAAWQYRRVKQQIADWLFDGNGTTFPVLELNRVEQTVTWTPAGGQ